MSASMGSGLVIPTQREPASEEEHRGDQPAGEAGPEQPAPGTAELCPEAGCCRRKCILRVADRLLQCLSYPTVHAFLRESERPRQSAFNDRFDDAGELLTCLLCIALENGLIVCITR